jgi:hypothetical protein
MGKLRVFSFNGLWLRDFCERFCGFKPNISNIFMSSFTSGFGVVNNLSPAKIEFAPAKKAQLALHDSCSFSG